MRQPEAQKSGRKATDLAVPQLVLPADVAKKVSQRIWLNETNGNRDAIWFPAGKTATFEEDFPPLLEFLRKESVHLPSWLDKTPIPPCPWTNRTDFMKKFNSPEMKQLRQFLLDTMAGQTQFLVARAQGAMDKILENTPDNVERERIISQFSRIARASKDLYPGALASRSPIRRAVTYRLLHTTIFPSAEIAHQTSAGPAVPPRVDRWPMPRLVTAEPSCARCRECAWSAMRATIGRH